ncbi:hypothetical protein FK514_29370, partial [Klebsiella pneumoniae]|nr:hypothetical protein [Klebsiella pneumoniae]
IRAAGNDPDGIVLRQRLAGGDRWGGEPVIFHRLLQHGGGGGEYPLQDGFGWTNGVTLKGSWLVNSHAKIVLFTGAGNH